MNQPIYSKRDVFPIDRLLDSVPTGLSTLNEMAADVRKAIEAGSVKPDDTVCREFARLYRSGGPMRGMLEWLMDITLRAPATTYPAGTETMEREAMAKRAKQARDQVGFLIMEAVNHGLTLMETDNARPD